MMIFLQAWALLLGGSQLSGWRSDMEVWDAEQRLPLMVADFPYAIDAPFAWWSPAAGLVVCGGKNWATDQVRKSMGVAGRRQRLLVETCVLQTESRCWRYSPCEEQAGGSLGAWLPIPPMPVALRSGTVMHETSQM